MPNQLSKSEIIKLFQGRVHCSQIVLGQWAEELGLDKDTCLRLAGPLGGGCFRGNVCGAVSGALLAIGARYGHCKWGDTDRDDAMKAKCAEFQDIFEDRCGSVICRELIGYDFSDPNQAKEAMESGVTLEKCPNYVRTALDILDEIME